MVLISARPFRIGDRVRLQGGGLAGQVEGTVASLGLLYVDLRAGRGLDHGPQQRRAVSSAVVPLREPAARRPARPPAPRRQARPRSRSCSQRGVRIPVRAEPHISLEEIDSDEVVVRIAATPESEEDGPRLADEVLSAIASVTREGDTDERPRRDAAPTGRRRRDRAPQRRPGEDEARGRRAAAASLAAQR